MKELGSFLVGLALSFSVVAAPKISPPDVSFDLDGQPVASIMRVIYLEAFPERAYFLDPTVLQDQRAISLRYGPKDGDFRMFLVSFLHHLGYSLEPRYGADFIKPIPTAERPSIAEDPNQEVFYYRTLHRDGAYLVEMLTPLFRGKFTTQRAVSVPATNNVPATSGGVAMGGSGASGGQPVAPEGSALAQIDRRID